VVSEVIAGADGSEFTAAAASQTFRVVGVFAGVDGVVVGVAVGVGCESGVG
jgi:hypothetical protein